MKTKTLLRISIVPVLIKFLGHSVGHSGWDKPEDPKMLEVVSTMKGYTGQFMGSSYNMAEYYTGYSLMILCIYLLAMYLIWIASGLVDAQPAISKSLVWPVTILFAVFGVLEFLFFFPFAASMSILASLLMVLALTVGKK
jgi:hypothetical protein